MQVFSKHNVKWLYLGLLLTPCSPAIANFVGDLGITQLQKDTGDSVLETCLGFVENDPNSTEHLFTTCSDMVAEAIAITNPNGETPSEATREEYAAALQQIATEEFAATQSMASEISNNQINSSLSRLAELRSGVRGFSVAGLFPALNADFADSTAYQSVMGTGGGAGDDWSKLGGFVTASYGDGDRDSTDRTNGFDYSSYSVIGGVDYRYNSNMVVGVALSYHDIDSDFDNKPTATGGDVDSDGWGASVYGTYYTGNAYIDGMLGYGTSDYDTKRNIIIPFLGINERAKGSTDSDDFTASIGAGYDFVNNALTYGPYARLSYLSVDVDGYTEKGAEASGLNLKVDDQKWKSLTSVLGAQFSYSMSQNFGVLIPQGSIGWVHEYENDSDTFLATYAADPRQTILRAKTNSPDRDYFELGLGVSAVLKSGVQVYANYDTVLDFDDLTQHLFSVGGRWEF